MFQFHNRLAINYPHVTLLINNLPLADHKRVERLQNYLAMLIENIKIHLQAMVHEAARLAQTQSISQALKALTLAQQDIEPATGISEKPLQHHGHTPARTKNESESHGVTGAQSTV